ncbi:MAG: flavin reductase family protein [Acidimicrobiales bacterium]
MSVAHRIVGPIPAGADPEAYDRLRRRVLWLMPSGLYLLGSASRGQRNLMTLNWATQVAVEPKLVAVSVEKSAVTHRLVSEGGVFSLSLLRREDRGIVRRFAKPATDEGETLSGVPVRSGRTGAPILEAALAWLDCQVRETVGATSHSLFIGEVVDCGQADEVAAGDSTAASGSEILRMEDTRMSYGG